MSMATYRLIEQCEQRWLKSSTFSIASWNVYDRVLDSLPRTNNSVEGWHNWFQRSLMCSHPIVWWLIEQLKKKERLQRFSIIYSYTCWTNRAVMISCFALATRASLMLCTITQTEQDWITFQVLHSLSLWIVSGINWNERKYWLVIDFYAKRHKTFLGETFALLE